VTKVWAVGDELAFHCGSHTSYWMIHKITKISKSGRISCGGYELNPDLTIRGRRDRWSGPWTGEPVTQEILDEIEDARKRTEALNTIESFRIRSLDTNKLVRIAAILSEEIG